jgi:OmpA-OmpF porin, OOP family
MRQNNIQTAILGLCLALVAGLAQAQTGMTISRGVYLGGSIGQSEAKEFNCVAFPQCENRGTVGKFFLGLQFGRNWSLEVALADLGQLTAATPGTVEQTVKVRLGELSLLPSYPLTDRFMVYGRAGAYYAQTTVSTDFTTSSSRVKESNGGLTWGAGAQYFVTNSIALRGDMQRYMKVGGGNIGDSDYNVFSVGVLLKIR